MEKLVSICIPTYNGEKYLQEALDSVKAQTYKNIEVIVSDNQSKDKTLEICEQFKSEVDFPVFIHSHTQSGIGENWNNTIEKSNGDYIKFLFQDDILEKNCVEVMMQYLAQYNLQAVVSKRNIINAESQLVTEGSWFNDFNDLQKPAGIPTDEFYIFSKKNLKNLNYDRYLVNNIVGEPCVSLFTKNVFKKVGRFDSNLKQALDYVYWLRVLAKYDIGIIPEKIVKFRYHSEQTSNQNYLNNLNEEQFISKILHNDLLFYIGSKNIKNHLKQRYPLLKRLVALRYRIFP
ncbi:MULTISPECIES: glycosyltransferase [unclassified Kaistella]|uniref:glycosyltransferase family 2 protein n=1 Tax=unclassified Kaistella TaxID=2762626 RepID=UPI002734B346|nr:MULTISPECIES: glycosyltransferase [unclassified Kaistella]MDP2454929.1 glycosyltransferase [Kaistella sp. SH11-4b]MDP2456088.1 glycosyltransferase [Kaistella sp. SH40-3]MDP2460599.1 glycosyltransferase [Kaistella sp. SH19-2b]